MDTTPKTNVRIVNSYFEPEGNVNELISTLKEYIKLAPEKYRDTVSVSYEEDYGGDLTWEFYYTRPMNSEELKEVAEMEKAVRQSRLDYYNRLKEEFGD